MSTFSMPTEKVSLPSKGLIYDKTNPLSSGEVEMRYMSAMHEDILTNINYLNDGTVIDRLLKALIVSDINIDDMVIGDKNALIVAARILGYGKDYEFKYKNKFGNEVNAKVDLSQLKEKSADETLFKPGKNEFEFKLPNTDNKVTFKLLTHKDEKDIELEIKGLKKIDSSKSYDASTRMKYTILSINGDKTSVRNFIDSGLLASDARALRKYITEISPDIELKYYPADTEEGVDIPVISFFWPDAGV